MDGPHTRQHDRTPDGHRRGGGRSGGSGVTRKQGHVKMEYRRVQNVAIADDKADGDASRPVLKSPLQSSLPSSSLKTSTLQSSSFKSSLQSSLRQSLEAEDTDNSTKTKTGHASTNENHRGRTAVMQESQKQQQPTKRAAAGRGPSPRRGGGGGRGSESGNGDRRSRSPRKVQASGLGAGGASGRRVTMTTTTSRSSVVSRNGARSERAMSIESNTSASSTSRHQQWVRKPSNGESELQQQTKTLVSSQDARFASSGGGSARGSYDRSSSRDAGSSSSFRRSEGGGGNSSSYRRGEVSQDRRSSASALTGARLARDRSESMESDASERSVQSVQSTHSVQSVHSVRSTASSRYESTSARSGGGDRYSTRRSIDDGARRGDTRSARYNSNNDDRAPMRRFERSTSGHSTTSSHSQSQSPALLPLRSGSTLGSSLLSHDARNSTATKPLATSSQDVRFSGTVSSSGSSLRSSLQSTPAAVEKPGPVSTTSAPFKSSLTSSSVEAKPFKSTLATSSVEPKPFKSSLASSSSEAKSFQSSLSSSPSGAKSSKSTLASSTHTGPATAVNVNVNDPRTNDELAPEEQERRRLAVARLTERTEARAVVRNSSLSQSAGKSSLLESVATPARNEKPSILSRIGDRAPASAPVLAPATAPSSDKETRTREFYAKLEQDDAQREVARRAAKPLISSLRESLVARRDGAAAKPVINKVVYTLSLLRSLKPTAPVPAPADLRDMTMCAPFETRPRTTANSGGGGNGGASSRRGDDSSRRGGSSKRGGLARGTSSGGSGRMVGKPPSKYDRHQQQRPGGGGGRGRGGPPPPPLYDGPIEPLQVSENRWVPKKAEMSALESTLSHIKSVLNKLTREKFAKLTEELCKTDINSLELLRSIITIIMDKAIQEPSFADVYSDLCKQFHIRTSSKVWSFLRAVSSTVNPGVFMWTAITPSDTAGFVGPFSSETECVNAATTNEPVSEETSTTNQDISKAKLFVTAQDLVAVVEASTNAFFYKKKPVATLTEDEPLLGEYDSAVAAIDAGTKQTSFKRLLVTKSQFEFERFNKTQADDENPDLDPRQKDLNAMRAKRLMLGNIRFIGELFKADLLNQSVVQACLFHLLGLELVTGGSDNQPAGREVRLPDEEDIEALCKLLATVGKKYDQPKKTQPVMRIVILRLVELSEEPKLPSRARFLLKDVLEMRDHLWEPRRKEMQQKTLDEVRREAKQLQSQGKNAQHDNLNQRRLKSQVSSVQLARESSNLLVRKDTLSEASTVTDAPVSPRSDVGLATTSSTPADVQVVDPNDAAKVKTRIKSIIQEFGSIHDIEEAATCLRELPKQHLADFAEHIVNRALEGKDDERRDVVDLLVKLYERGAIDATSIQLALVNVIEFLEDMKIDIPLVHEYSAHLFGRLIAAGCFGLSWMVSKALQDLLDCGLASLVFAEALPVIEADSDERTVIRMVADEEITVGAVLPPSMRRNEAAIAAFIEEHDLGVYFGAEREQDEEDEDEDEDDHHGADDELDADMEAKLKSTLVEYLSVKDLDEVVLCVTELEGSDGVSMQFLWRHFAHVCIQYSLDERQSTRLEVAALLARLVVERSDTVDIGHVAWAFETALIDYEDVCVDVPRLAHNFAELWTALFEMQKLPVGLTLAWLHDAVMHLLGSDAAAEILSALLSHFDAQYGREKLVEWWRSQPRPDETAKSWLAAFSLTCDSDTGPGTASAIHEKLTEWEPVLDTK